MSVRVSVRVKVRVRVRVRQLALTRTRTLTLTLALIQVIETASAYDIVSGQWHEVEGVVPRSGLRMTSRGGEP